MRYFIKNGSIIDPVQRVATVGHVLVEDGVVSQLFDLAELSQEQEPSGADLEVIHANGCVISPGFTDLHVHLREPGQEYKETVATGVQAAAHGGFTTICAMPNTEPAADRVSVIQQVQAAVRRAGPIQVDLVGAITLGRAGQTLTEMAELAEAGCIGFSDDGSPVMDPAMMRHALTYASMLDIPLMCHCEDTRMNPGWAMHEGAVSTRLGLPGYPAAAEESHIARDIALAELTGAHLHICHVSTAGGVNLIREAKARGVRVTAEVTPHHLTLTDRWVLGSLATDEPTVAHGNAETAASSTAEETQPQVGSRLRLNARLLSPYDTSTRVSPPLRTMEDVEALIEGLQDGTIDAIATDHAPHALQDKQQEYGVAACGISGLETALALVLTLVHGNEMDLMNIVARLTEGPAQVLGRSPNSLRPGTRADIVVFDTESIWTVDTAAFVSKGKNSPLHGQQLKGRVMLTMAGGDIVFRHAAFGTGDTGALQSSRLEGILPEEQS